MLAAAAVTGFIWGGSVSAVLAATFTYRWFSAGKINSYQLTAAEMQANYDRVINYSLFPWIRELNFDTLPMSAAGRQHFAEAKDIFQIFVQTGLICLLIALIVGGWVWHRQRSAGFLSAGAIAALVIPLILAIPLAIDFDRAFVVFHQIAFDNELWIFDPNTDPIINYLPEALFMRNAFAILALMVTLAIAAIVIGRRAQRTNISARRNT